MYGNRILIIHNGARQTGQQWGADHAPEVDMNGSSSVSVIKGSDAVRYGSDALGGIIVMEQSPLPFRKRSLQGGISALYGSNGRRQNKFYVQKNGEYKNGNNFTPAPVYLMFIYYYNSKGELMNGQFVENGQENIHQHFFTPENVRPTFDGKPEADDNDPEALVDYLYVDTTPWDKTKHDNEAEITGGTNPVGLKGVIRFLKDRKEFDLKLRLYHGYNSKKNPQTNGFDPFYKPSGVLIQRGTWDINLSIPVVVFWSREEFVDVDPEADVNLIGEDSLDEDSNRTLHSIMKTFNLTWKEALEEFISYTYQAGDVEAGSIWL